MPTIDEEIAALEAEAARKAKQKRLDLADAAKQDALAYAKAHVAALDQYDPDHLITCEIAGVGNALLHWPKDAVYSQYMRDTGALRGDLTNMNAATMEALIAGCAIYPPPAILLERLREKNPHARTKLASLIIDVMTVRHAKEGK